MAVRPPAPWGGLMRTAVNSFSYFRRYWANTAALGVADAVALIAAVAASGAVRYLFRGHHMIPAWSWLLIPVWWLAAGITKMLPDWGLGPVEHFRRTVLLLLGLFGGGTAAVFLSKAGEEVSRLTFTNAFVFALLLVPMVRLTVKRFLISRRWWGLPAVIYGNNEIARQVLEAMRHETGLGYFPVGAFYEEQPGIPSFLDDLPRLGGLEQTTESAAVAVVAARDMSSEELVSLLEGPLAVYQRIIIVPDLLETPTLWVSPRDFLGVLGLEVTSNLLNPLARVAKRFTEILLVLLVAPLWIPACLIIAGLIVLEDRAHPFFTQERIGLGGTRFRTYKFRTMLVNAEEALKRALEEHPELEGQWSGDFKLKEDPRVTNIGRLLRRYSLDELPQFLNVLKGDMALVGPRPLPAYHHHRLPERARALRERVRPGVTGLWQVSGRSEAGTGGMVKWDTYYVRNWSVWLDMVIIVRTLRAVVTGRGAY